MATQGTLNSQKFQALLTGLQGQATFRLQACNGLADAIENAVATKIVAACAYYTGAMGTFGSKSGSIDTPVLGCTAVADFLHHGSYPNLEKRNTTLAAARYGTEFR
jgi:glutamate racemase